MRHTQAAYAPGLKAQGKRFGERKPIYYSQLAVSVISNYKCVLLKSLLPLNFKFLV